MKLPVIDELGVDVIISCSVAMELTDTKTYVPPGGKRDSRIVIADVVTEIGEDIRTAMISGVIPCHLASASNLYEEGVSYRLQRKDPKLPENANMIATYSPGFMHTSEQNRLERRISSALLLIDPNDTMGRLRIWRNGIHNPHRPQPNMEDLGWQLSDFFASGKTIEERLAEGEFQFSQVKAKLLQARIEWLLCWMGEEGPCEDFVTLSAPDLKTPIWSR